MTEINVGNRHPTPGPFSLYTLPFFVISFLEIIATVQKIDPLTSGFDSLQFIFPEYCV
jgi:hypothetical protein